VSLKPTQVDNLWSNMLWSMELKATKISRHAGNLLLRDDKDDKPADDYSISVELMLNLYICLSWIVNLSIIKK